MAARRFLYVIAGLIMLLLGMGLVYNLFGEQIFRHFLIPTVAFDQSPQGAAPDYSRPAAWLSRPGLPQDPARWAPKGFAPTEQPSVEVFYVAPTTYLRRERWNAPLDDPQANYYLRLFAQSQASAFNGVGAIWAPKYRQATFGAFLTGGADAGRAIDLAYRDVLAAYEEFLREAPADRPIILAAHSQGSLHLLRLLHERIRGAPEASRIVAVYLAGWPVSINADLPALPLPACAAPDQARCLLAWQSFAEPADPGQIAEAYDTSRGFTGAPRAGSAMLCTNPLTGAPGGAAPAGANLGTLIPDAALSTAEFRRGAVGARCGERGLLLIGAADALPAMGGYVLPGNNYHVYDYALFWANLRADAERRLAVYEAAR